MPHCCTVFVCLPCLLKCDGCPIVRFVMLTVHLIFCELWFSQKQNYIKCKSTFGTQYMIGHPAFEISCSWLSALQLSNEGLHKRCIRAMLGRINFEKRSSAMPSAISQTSGLFGKVCCRPVAAPPPPPRC